MAEQDQRAFGLADEAQQIGRIVAARKRRARMFSTAIFADPAWDIMLELFHAELEKRNFAITELSDKIGVPLTTSLRWIEKLEANGWVRRVSDPADRRRFFVELSSSGVQAMQEWLRDWLDIT